MHRTSHRDRSVASIEHARTLASVCAVCIVFIAPVASAQDTLVPPPVAASQAPDSAAEKRTGVSDLNPRPLGPSDRALGARPAAPANDTASRAAPTGGSITQTLASLGMVIGLILAIGAGLKKLMRSRSGIASALGSMGGGPSPAGILEVLGRYPLSRGTSLVMLKVDRRILLLAQGSTGLRVRGGAPMPTTLCEITDPEEVASILIKTNEAEGRSIGASFRQALAGFERQHDGVIEEPRPSLLGRLIRRGSDGDRAELLDPHSINKAGDPLRLQEFDHANGDSVGSLRSRLTALRGGGAR